MHGDREDNDTYSIVLENLLWYIVAQVQWAIDKVTSQAEIREPTQHLF